MHKIYSRVRILYVQKLLKIFIILLVAFGVVTIAYKSIEPVFNALCKDKAKGIATKISNEEATNIMKEYKYQDLFSIERDSNGNISMIKSNIFPINEIISGIAVKVQERLENQEKENIKIPIGMFSGLRLFAGNGPDIKVRIVPIGNVETDLKSEFIDKGINQTLHRVYLQIKCNVSILTLFATSEESITNQVLIAENVIVGQIPSNYYNLKGVNNTRAIDIVE